MRSSLVSPVAPAVAGGDTPEAATWAASCALRGTSGHHDELRGSLTGVGEPAAAPHGAAELAPVWRQFFNANGVAGWHDLSARLARVQRRVREDGATYNVYADSGDRDSARQWPLELLPLLITAQEWGDIEAGVSQRARLLDAALQDVYGEQRLLHQGLLPASLVLAHPQYLRPMHGAQPAGGRWLHVVALDLARSPQGDWRVVGQRTQAPSGLGYLLENRLIVGQQFPEAFRAMRVQRVASSFRALMDGLMQASPAGERSRVALLTPGPRNETYFEHVFLARYLGVSLVEGSDLTVRHNKLYLKTLHGLEQVHVLLRRVDDEWLDPLELRADSALGIPGLLQAVRAGEVLVANAPGAGVLESPGLSAFWPGVARAVLGEELQLPSHTSWWCGEASVWAAHRPRLRDYVIVPTFPMGAVTQSFAPVMASGLEPAQLKAWEARIEADPAAHTLMAPARPSELPVWRAGLLEPRAVVLRVYAVSDGQGGWRVLPGGMTRVRQRRNPDGQDTTGSSSHSGGTDAYLSMQAGSASTDTWVLTEGEIDATSLLPRPLAPADLVNRTRVITSRAAENLFWLGRYTERAENTVRLARVTLEALPSASPPVLRVLHRLLLRHGLIRYDTPSPVQTDPVSGADTTTLEATRALEQAVIHALGDRNGSVSVAFNLHALRQCAEALRERLSTEHWGLIKLLDELFARQIVGIEARAGHEPLSDVLGVLHQAALHLAAITGAQTDRMTRDDGWRLLSVARQVERLDMLAHALQQGFQGGLPHSDEGFALLLGLFDSTITYRAHFQARREVPPLLHLLVLDTDNPRSLAWVARTLRERLRKLSRHDAAWCDTLGLPVPENWSLDSLSHPGPLRDYPALQQALQACGQAVSLTSNEISRHLFSHVGPADRAVWQ